MPNYDFIGKARLSRDFSFPLKRSALDAFLDEHDIKIVTSVAYCEPSHQQRVFAADYRGPQRRGMAHSLTLWINAVPASLRQYIAAQIENMWLGEVERWMAQFANQSQLVSQTDHRFEIYYNDVHDDGICHLERRLDQSPMQRRAPRFRMKVRP